MGLFANKKLFYSRRGSREGPENNFGTSRPSNRREVPSPTPPARSSDGRYPFSEILPISTPFSNLKFFYPFSKKTPKPPWFSTSAGVGGVAVASVGRRWAQAAHGKLPPTCRQAEAERWCHVPGATSTHAEPSPRARPVPGLQKPPPAATRAPPGPANGARATDRIAPAPRVHYLATTPGPTTPAPSR
jgi:hypothetical protein